MGEEIAFDLGQNILLCFSIMLAFLNHDVLKQQLSFKKTQKNLFFKLPQIFYISHGQENEALRSKCYWEDDLCSRKRLCMTSKSEEVLFSPGGEDLLVLGGPHTLSSKDKLTCCREAHNLVLQSCRIQAVTPSNCSSRAAQGSRSS